MPSGRVGFSGDACLLLISFQIAVCSLVLACLSRRGFSQWLLSIVQWPNACSRIMKSPQCTDKQTRAQKVLINWYILGKWQPIVVLLCFTSRCISHVALFPAWRIFCVCYDVNCLINWHHKWYNWTWIIVFSLDIWLHRQTEYFKFCILWTHNEVRVLSWNTIVAVLLLNCVKWCVDNSDNHITGRLWLWW